jgi:hypothetical protein
VWCAQAVAALAAEDAALDAALMAAAPVAAMRLHPLEAGVQEWCAAALTLVAGGAANRHTLARAGACEVIVVVMRVHCGVQAVWRACDAAARALSRHQWCRAELRALRSRTWHLRMNAM